jgi:hypothetical protein
MNNEVAAEELTAEHLHDVEYVEACSETDRVRVWAKNSLPVFVKDAESPVTNTLFVRVSSTSDADIELLKIHVRNLWDGKVKNSVSE